MHKDTLTGLPNRDQLLLNIQQTADCVLYIINVDRFSEMNNLFGIDQGDLLLQHLAKSLEKKLPENSILYKLPSDEYAILWDLQTLNTGHDTLPWQQMEDLAASIVDGIAGEVFSLSRNEEDPYPVIINVSLGICISQLVDQQNVYTCADSALKTARQQRKPYLFYKQPKNAQNNFETNISWSRKLKQAIEEDRIVAWFQPIINNSTGQVEKYESLMRLIATDGSVISPYFFLELSKAIRLYPQLTRYMIKNVGKVQQGISESISINLSIDDILDVDISESLFQVLATKERETKVSFEILESDGIENYDEVTSFIHEVQKLGAQVGIDDFGVGYSNFSHILQLNVDFVKIDGSLIKNIHEDRNSEVIVRSIVSFARDLGIKTVAEYVHCKEVLDKVTELGVDYSQGFYLAEPRDKPIYTPPTTAKK